MLVLLNQEVFDVGDPMETLNVLGVADVRMLNRAQLVRLGQNAAFTAGGLERAHNGVRRTLAALMALSGEANCALFICPQRARSPQDVAVRLGYAPLTTMVYLLSAQQNGQLTPAMINEQVWRLAGGVAAA